MGIIKRFPFAVILLLHIIFYFILYLFITPYFLSDDDTAMMLRVSGRLLIGHPTANILFSNVILGMGLKSLYNLSGAIPWYALYYMSVLILSNTILCYVLIKTMSFRNGIIFYLIYFLLAGCFLAAEWQFTILSYIAFGAGMAAFYFYPLYEKKTGSKISLGIRAIGLVMLLLSFVIRYESFMSSFILMVPLLVIHTYYSKSIRMPLQLTALVIVLFLLNIFSGMMQDKIFNDYYTFNAVETSVQEYHKIETQTSNKEALAMVNWTPNDVVALKNWFFFDSSVFNIHKFQTILAAPGISGPHFNITDLLTSHLNFIRRYPFFFMALLFFLITILVSFKVRRPQIIFTFLMFGWAYFILSLVAIFLKYPIFRVQFPLLLLTCFICVSHLVTYGEGLRRMALRAMILPALMAFVFLCMEINKIDSQNRENNKVLAATLLKTKSYPIVIQWGGGLSLDCIPPFSNATQYQGYKILGLGCFEQSDEDKRYLQDAGISSIKEAIYNKHLPVIIESKVSDHYIPILKTFGEEHYGLKVAIDTLFRNDKLIAIAVK